MALQNELQHRLNDIQEGKFPDMDWTVWYQKVEELRAHLAGQLEGAAPRFAQTSLTTGLTAKHSDILDSINSFRAQI